MNGITEYGEKMQTPTEEYNKKGEIIGEFSVEELVGENHEQQVSTNAIEEKINHDSEITALEEKAELKVDKKEQNQEEVKVDAPEEKPEQQANGSKEQDEKATPEGIAGGFVFSMGENKELTIHGAFVREVKLDIPQELRKALENAYKNVFDKDNIIALARAVTIEIPDTVFNSPDMLKNVLDRLGLPYDENKNIIVADKNSYTAYFMGDKQNEQEKYQENTQIAEQVDGKGNEGVEKADKRVNTTANIGSGDIYSIAEAKTLEEFNGVINGINDSKEGYIDKAEVIKGKELDQSDRGTR